MMSLPGLSVNLSSPLLITFTPSIPSETGPFGAKMDDEGDVKGMRRVRTDLRQWKRIERTWM